MLFISWVYWIFCS